MQLLSKIVCGLFLAGLAFAADQTRTGAGNARAEEIGPASPVVRSALTELIRNSRRIHDPLLREKTLDAIVNAQTCLAHRANLSEVQRKQILERLIDEKLLTPEAGAGIGGGTMAGVFPPARAEGSSCPQIPLSFAAAPGSSFGSHHSYPGGLVLHEAFNQANALGLMAAYRRIYPVSALDTFQADLLLAAPVWHDWSKVLVFQWNEDGTEFKEMTFGGTGKNDNFGKPGDSRTGAHHILSLAEAMSRNLSPLYIVTQASAHAAPTFGNEYKLVNWIRAAAIVARVDPVGKGYLVRDPGDQHLKLPTGMRLEYQMHHLSDADYVNAVPAVEAAEILLARLAPRFGYDPAQTRLYNTQFRNVVLSRLTAEQIELIVAQEGEQGVVAQIKKLQAQKAVAPAGEANQ